MSFSLDGLVCYLSFAFQRLTESQKLRVSRTFAWTIKSHLSLPSVATQSVVSFHSNHSPVALSLNFPFSRLIKRIKAPHNSAAGDIYRRANESKRNSFESASQLERQIEKRINIFQLKLIIQRTQQKREKGSKRFPFEMFHRESG